MKIRKYLALLLMLMMLTGSVVAFAQEPPLLYDTYEETNLVAGEYDLSTYNPDFIFFKKGSDTVYMWFSSALTQAQKTQILADANTIDPSLAGTFTEIAKDEVGAFTDDSGKMTATVQYEGAKLHITGDGINHYTAGKIKNEEPTLGSLTVSKHINIDGLDIDDVQRNLPEDFALPQTFEFELEKWDNGAWVKTETTFSLTVTEEILVPSTVLTDLDPSILYRVVETTPNAPDGYIYTGTSYTDGTAKVDVRNSYLTGTQEAGKGHVSVKKFLVDTVEKKALPASDIMDYEITVTLHASTTGAPQVGEAITLSAKNNWTNAWINIEPGEYIVREAKPDDISDFIRYSGVVTTTSAEAPRTWTSLDASITVTEGETIGVEYTNLYNVLERPPVDPEANFSFSKSVSGLPVGTYTFGFKAEVDMDGVFTSFAKFDGQNDLAFDLTVEVAENGATTFAQLTDDALIARIENALCGGAGRLGRAIRITEIESSATRYTTGNLRYNGMTARYNGASRPVIDGFGFVLVPSELDPATQAPYEAYALEFHNAYASSSALLSDDPLPPIPLGEPIEEEVPLGPPLTGAMPMLFAGIAVLLMGAALLGTILLKRAK